MNAGRILSLHRRGLREYCYALLRAMPTRKSTCTSISEEVLKGGQTAGRKSRMLLYSISLKPEIDCISGFFYESDSGENAEGVIPFPIQICSYIVSDNPEIPSH